MGGYLNKIGLHGHRIRTYGFLKNPVPYRITVSDRGSVTVPYPYRIDRNSLLTN
jgi:hypothetical protein